MINRGKSWFCGFCEQTYNLKEKNRHLKTIKHLRNEATKRLKVKMYIETVGNIIVDGDLAVKLLREKKLTCKAENAAGDLCCVSKAECFKVKRKDKFFVPLCLKCFYKDVIDYATQEDVVMILSKYHFNYQFNYNLYEYIFLQENCEESIISLCTCCPSFCRINVDLQVQPKIDGVMVEHLRLFSEGFYLLRRYKYIKGVEYVSIATGKN